MGFLFFLQLVLEKIYFLEEMSAALGLIVFALIHDAAQLLLQAARLPAAYIYIYGRLFSAYIYIICYMLVYVIYTHTQTNK